MDINVLEEQYNCLKQKQKLQTHIIVFKTVQLHTKHVPTIQSRCTCRIDNMAHINPQMLQKDGPGHTSTLRTRLEQVVDPSCAPLSSEKVLLHQEENGYPHSSLLQYDAEPVPRESMINAVLINKKFKKGKALNEHIPTREVNLELPCGRNVQESSPWRIHLGIHRIVQGEHLKTPCDVGRNNNEEISNDSKKLLEEENVISHGELLTGSEQSIELLSKQGNSSPVERTGSSSSPLTSVSSVVWTRTQISTSKFAPSASKLPYYPFPQKKTPRISEAARKLGLYIS